MGVGGSENRKKRRKEEGSTRSYRKGRRIYPSYFDSSVFRVLAYILHLKVVQTTSSTMPIADRLDWIARQVELGRKVHISCGEARDAGKSKFKIVLQAASAGMIDPCVAQVVKSVLSHVRVLANTHIAVDRGHRYSSDISEVCIWITWRIDAQLVTTIAPVVDALPNVVAGNTSSLSHASHPKSSA